eukprot:SAG11_NODE_973_length_6335_cov_5.646889_3_plen_78_part_00
MSRAQFEESFSLDEDGQIDGLDFVKVALEQIYYHMLDLSYESIKYGERDKGVEKHIRQCRYTLIGIPSIPNISILDP